jgi:hypothetical protein
MKTLHFRQKAEANGQLRLDIPVGKADAECEVVVVVEPTVTPKDWLPGFWQQLSQGWQGEPLARPAQGECDRRDSLR